MDPKNIKPIVDIAKKHGPKAVVFINDNAENFVKLYNAAQETKNKFIKDKKNKVEVKEISFSKEHPMEFAKIVMKNLDKYDREGLYNHKLDVKQFIEQIDMDMAQEMKAKKPLHNNRKKKWESFLIQIDGKLKTKDYREYLKIYNSSEHTSTYFAGFERNVKIFKELVEKADSDEIIHFLVSQTGMDPEEIKNEFLI